MPDNNNLYLNIEIVYALPNQLSRFKLSLTEGSTIADALNHAEFFKHHPEYSPDTIVTGIYGEQKSLNHVLKNNDRIEIYRPLTMDPKTRRRLRDAVKKSARLKQNPS